MGIKYLSINNEVLDVSKILTQDTMYPVGSIYISILSQDEFNPNDYFVGTWEKIQNCVLYADGTHTIGETGGSETVTLSQAQIPYHTHTRGTMEITGQLSPVVNNGHAGNKYASGAFEGMTVSENDKNKLPLVEDRTQPPGTIYGYKFTASRSWTGETSSCGNNESHSNMMPYLVCSIWKRVN